MTSSRFFAGLLMSLLATSAADAQIVKGVMGIKGAEMS